MNFGDFTLDTAERAYLAALVPNPGWKVFESIFKDEVEKFQFKLLNADPTNQKEVLEAHRMAKAAAQVYAGVMNRVNAEIEAYAKAPRASDKPFDPIEDGLDLGNISEEMS